MNRAALAAGLFQARFLHEAGNADAREFAFTFMIVNRQRRVPVAIHPLQQFYERVRHELGFAPESVTVQLISDATMAQLNETYRNKSGPTDVLSFPANGGRPKKARNMSATSPSLPKPHAATRAAIRVPCPWSCGS